MRVQSRWHEVDGRKMHARVAVADAPPGRPPVVMVHGLSISSRYMVPTLRTLGLAFPCYAPDLPGFGLSDHPDEPLDVPGHADALVAWMDAEGIGKAHLLANSLGCQIVTDLAARYPERVLRMVLVCPTVYTRDSRTTLAWRVLKDSVRERPQLIGIHLLDDLHARPLRILKTFEAGRRHPFLALLARVQAPTLVVRGGKDPLMPPGWASEVARLVPDGRVVDIVDAPHAVNYTAPERLALAVRPFLLEEAHAAASGPAADPLSA